MPAWIRSVDRPVRCLTAVAQTDIKRISLSTISQLGFMMMGIATGGPAVGVVHYFPRLFQALLFLGAGSVIHGCHGNGHPAIGRLATAEMPG